MAFLIHLPCTSSGTQEIGAEGMLRTENLSKLYGLFWGKGGLLPGRALWGIFAKGFGILKLCKDIPKSPNHVGLIGLPVEEMIQKKFPPYFSVCGEIDSADFNFMSTPLFFRVGAQGGL